MVPSTGPRNARIALIGEAPGSDEARAGEPFVGRAGRVLNNLLQVTGLSRDELYITNVVKEHPPGNNISKFLLATEKEVTTTEAYDAYEAQLIAELAEVEANVLVPLGNVAFWALTRQWGISNRRGSIYEARPELGGRKVIPTLHPASTFPNRQPINYHMIAADLRRIKEESAFPEVRLPQRTLHLYPSLDDAFAYLDACAAAPIFGFDTESSVQRDGSGLCTREPIMFSLALSATDAMVVPLVAEDGSPAYDEHDELRLLAALSRALRSPATKVMQNAMYDASLWYHRYGMRALPVEDTMVAHGILAPDFPMNLGFLTSLYTREPYFKDEGPKYWKGGSRDWDAFLRYSALDAAILLDLWPKLEADLRRMGNWESYAETMRTLPALIAIQEQGLPVNVRERKRIATRLNSELRPLKAELDRLWLAHNEKDPAWCEAVSKLRNEIATSKRGTKGKEAQLHRLTHFGDNTRSCKQKGEWFYNVLGNKRPKSNPTDAKQIKMLAARGTPGAKELALIAQAENDISRYWASALDPDGIARCHWKLPGTWTGRFACEKGMFGTGFQFQNIPDRMKELITAPPGYAFLEMDYSQIENRLVAHFAGATRMIEAFQNGEDLHCLTAGLIFGKPPSEISREKGSCPLGDGKHSERDWGKRGNHSLNYRLSWMGFMQRFEVDARTSKFVCNGYHKAWPEISNVFWRDVEHDVNTKRCLTNMFGRKRFFHAPINDRLMRQATAYPAQSVAPYLVNTRMFMPAFESPDRYPRIHVANQVHDSAWFLVPLDDPEGVDAFINETRERAEAPLTFGPHIIDVPVDAVIGLTADKDSMLSYTGPETLEKLNAI